MVTQHDSKTQDIHIEAASSHLTVDETKKPLYVQVPRLGYVSLLELGGQLVYRMFLGTPSLASATEEFGIDISTARTALMLLRFTEPLQHAIMNGTVHEDYWFSMIALDRARQAMAYDYLMTEGPDMLTFHQYCIKLVDAAQRIRYKATGLV